MNKPKGRELEEYIQGRLDKVDGWAHTTIGSGAIFNDEDVRSYHFLIQCKDTTKVRRYTINADDMAALLDNALHERTPDNDYRIGVFITRNSEGNIVASLDLEDFLGLVDTMTIQEAWV